MKKLKKERDVIILNRRMLLRPKPENLYHRNIAPTGTFGDEVEIALLDPFIFTVVYNVMNILALEESFKGRPGMEHLLEQGVIDPVTLTMSRNQILRRNEFGTEEDSDILKSQPARGRFIENDSGLGKALRRRPSVTDLMVKNILWNDPSIDAQAQVTERRQHRRRTSELLDQKLAERPDINSLVERGIIIETNDMFVAEVATAMQRVQNMGMSDQHKRLVSKIIADLLTQHNITVHDMNQRHVEKMKEYKRMEDEAHKESRRRERKLRTELDNRARLIAHNNAVIERYEQEKKEAQQEMSEEIKKMKEDYEEQLRILQESTRIPISTSVPSLQQMNADFNQYYRSYVQSLQQLQQSISQSRDTNSAAFMNNVVQQTTQLNTAHNNQIEKQKKELTTAFQSQMNARKQAHDEEFAKLQEHHNETLKTKTEEIEKLKQQKKEMSQIVTKKLQNLQYTHEKEIEKERTIATLLQQNLKEQKKHF
ncbi:hypothetical protein RFI_09518 [Reticulomyxa filosa]|uniref:Uncharacterized protein n=1 Tax=Reticulomyxa filosa TaxID=46433 RepID=X6NNN3_RETFI|nr:hypothetical protein RFI_09518 [Reticulomyxa filosa]|eukprot:ETO27616.1 hypothetical protein RFI_09518 [Reticulomyxa filosa]